MWMGIFGTAALRRRNPWVAAWWSAALPGFGHMQLGMYIKGIVFLSGEIMLNFLGHINLAIFYTFNLQWDKAREVINYDFAFLYAAIWTFAIYDSYRISVEGNKLAWLEAKQKIRHFEHGILRTHDFNIMDKRSPWVAFFWGCVFSGLGHMYNNKLILGFILVGWTYAIVFNTHLPLLIIYTCTGQFERIADVVNYEWLLFFPSIYFFGMYDAYSATIEGNQLFKEEQAYHFKEIYGGNELDLL